MSMRTTFDRQYLCKKPGMFNAFFNPREGVRERGIPWACWLASLGYLARSRPGLDCHQKKWMHLKNKTKSCSWLPYVCQETCMHILATSTDSLRLYFYCLKSKGGGFLVALTWKTHRDPLGPFHSSAPFVVCPVEHSCSCRGTQIQRYG